MSETTVMPARIAALVAAIAASRRPRRLFVSHGGGGGVERHIRDRIEWLRASRDVLVLRGTLEGNVEVAWYGSTSSADASVTVGGFSAETVDAWVTALAAIGFERLELHHLHGWPRPAADALIEQMTERGCGPLEIVLHDYALISPRYHLEDDSGRYVGLPNLDDPAARTWFERGRLLLERAQNIIAPSADVADRFRTALPDLQITLQPHDEAPIEIPSVLKVGLIGGLSRVKGLDVVKAVAGLVTEQRLPIAFRLIGHASEPLPAGVTATGTYDEAELPALLATERMDVFWFPHQVPETWNYALSAAMVTGRPIVASDLGSSRERLAGHASSALLPFDTTPQAWLDALRAAAGHSSDVAMLSTRLPPPAAVGAGPATETMDGTSPLSVDRLSRLLHAAPPPKRVDPYPLLTFLRLGRYAGHRASADAVEQHLEAIGAHETHIVGRSAFDAVTAHRDALQTTVNSQNAELTALRSQLMHMQAQMERLEVEVDRLKLENQAAQAELSRVNAELMATSQHLIEVTRSRSWRWTRPLRGAHLAARLAKDLLAAPSRVPTALSTLRHEGLRAAIAATQAQREANDPLKVPCSSAQEPPAPEPPPKSVVDPAASAVMPAPPDPVTPALSAEFNAAVRLFPERLKSPWWIGHIPFAYELIARHRPRTIVELGTYSGSSFAAFCQAMETHGIEGTCHGVDLWEGDVHMGRFDESLFLEMSEFTRTRYPHHARLVRKLFDQAVHDFADGSIDLLHIDGTHTYEAVKNDFETWLPKVSARGVVLFHDIHVTEENCGPSARKFGVRRLFDEIKVGRPHCEFLHCFGLGVLAVGRDVPAEVLGFIKRCHASEVQAFFGALGDRVLAHYHALGEPPPAHAEYGDAQTA
jgi:glycosyltransferase involved in cell wall biosynthesis/predicted O-methyltransferase YrrM/outer membrane murein-binding lipoprotein Lpp